MKNNRWFIWTLVFLVVAGVGLVAYINFAGDSVSNQAIPSFVVHQAKSPEQGVRPTVTPVPKK